MYIAKVKVEVKEEPSSMEENESDENGTLSASSVDGATPSFPNETEHTEKMTQMIELGMRKYNFDIFMKRAQGNNYSIMINP